MEPIRIGWLGAALDGPGGGYDKIHRLAFDEAIGELPQYGTVHEQTAGGRATLTRGAESPPDGAFQGEIEVSVDLAKRAMQQIASAANCSALAGSVTERPRCVAIHTRPVRSTLIELARLTPWRERSPSATSNSRVTSRPATS